MSDLAPGSYDIPPNIKDKLQSLSTTEIADALVSLDLSKHVSLLTGLQPFVPPVDEKTIVGRVFTVQMGHHSSPTPPLKEHHLDLLPPHSVLLLTTPPSPSAIFGDLMSLAARQKETSAVLVDGNVRDLRGLREVGVPLWARGVSTFGTRGFGRCLATGGAIGFPAASGAGDNAASTGANDNPPSPNPTLSYPLTPLPTVINPTDLILADINGILLLPFSQFHSHDVLIQVIERAERGRETDARIARDLKAGMGVGESMRRWR